VKRFLVALLVVTTVGFAAAGCGNPEPFDISGTTVGTGTTADGPPLTEGNAVTIKTTEREDVTGDLVGTMESKVTLVVDRTTGALTIEYDATFTGKIGDKSGTSTSHGVGTGQMTSQTAGSWTADETVTGGTGDFEGITGTIHTKGEFSSAGSGTEFTGTLQYK
jgi:hypothetical protein